MQSSKTATSELLTRYIWLATTIYSAGKISYEDISQKWHDSCLNNSKSKLPARTFHAHRKAVEELFDIDIRCDKGDGFLYYIDNSDDFEKGCLRRWLMDTLAVSNELRESKSMRDRILLEDIPSGMNYLTDIIDAIKQNETLELTHRSFHRDAEYSFLMEPYCIKLSGQRWYVLGHNKDIDSIRVYALDRLTGCKAAGTRFNMPADFDCAAFFSDYFGVYVDPNVKIETVKIMVDLFNSNYIRSLPLHHSQKEIERRDDGSTFEYIIRPTVDFIDKLVSMSSYARVLEPQWLADEVKKKIDEIKR